MTRASARHILVDEESFCDELKLQIEGGVDFADAAKEHRRCPRGTSSAPWAATVEHWANSAPARWFPNSTRSSSAASWARSTVR